MAPRVQDFDRSGVIYHFQYNDISNSKDKPYLDNNSAPGSNGGYLSGFGLSWVKDSRNLTFYPSKGRLYTIDLVYYAKRFGSGYDFTHLTVDLREYFPAWGKWGVLAVQLYGEFVSGSPPFYKYPALGGSSRMRGFFYGRFRDKDYIMSQAEYRRHIWWKLGGVLFLGFGQVAQDLSRYRLDSFHTSYGFGLRYLFNSDEHVNLRADFGFGKDDSTTGVYFGLEETF